MATLASVLLAAWLSLSAQPDDDLLGPPPPIPHVGLVQRPAMQVRERHEGQCGPLRFDVGLVHVEARPGFGALVSRVTRASIGTDRKRHLGRDDLRPDRSAVSVRDIGFVCNGEDRLVVTLTLRDQETDETAVRMIEVRPEGVTYDFTRAADDAD